MLRRLASDRDVDAASNDAPESRCAATPLIGDGPNRGTPGEVNGVCAVCGDGLSDSPEKCDDGNREAGDGCDAFCLVE